MVEQLIREKSIGKSDSEGNYYPLKVQVWASGSVTLSKQSGNLILSRTQSKGMAEIVNRELGFAGGDIKPHLIDGIKSCREGDTKQAEHNLFELADHLGINLTGEL